MKIILSFLLIGSLQTIVAGNIGDPTIDREATDTFSGYLYAYDGTFGAYGVVNTWSIYAGSENLDNLDVGNIIGHQITPVIDRNYFWSIYFRTPGGVLFEIATNEPGFNHDEDTAQLGEALKLPAQHEHLRASLEMQLAPISN